MARKSAHRLDDGAGVRELPPFDGAFAPPRAGKVQQLEIRARKIDGSAGELLNPDGFAGTVHDFRRPGDRVVFRECAVKKDEFDIARRVVEREFESIDFAVGPEGGRQPLQGRLALVDLVGTVFEVGDRMAVPLPDDDAGGVKVADAVRAEFLRNHVARFGGLSSGRGGRKGAVHRPVQVFERVGVDFSAVAEMGDITVWLNQERIGGVSRVELEHPVFFIECDRHGDSSCMSV